MRKKREMPRINRSKMHKSLNNRDATLKHRIWSNRLTWRSLNQRLASDGCKHARYLRPGAWYLRPDARYLRPDARYLRPNARYPHAPNLGQKRQHIEPNARHLRPMRKSENRRMSLIPLFSNLHFEHFVNVKSVNYKQGWNI